MKKPFTIYSYIIRNDLGFSPNPFWGVCTLACCKPIIRRTAKVGDWVVGIRGKGLYNKLKLPKPTDPFEEYGIVYAMKVTKKLSFDEYFDQFPEKQPNFGKGETIFKRGDNIYKPLGNGEYVQLKSRHTIPNQPKDLSGKYVILSNEFYYFGSNPIRIPDNMRVLICGRGHKCHTDKALKGSFLDYISSNKLGISERPSLWNEHDNSWKQ